MTRPADRSSKGERTRRRIVESASLLFNTRGVAGASMADISAATGLEKGGVYNHFATKEELAIAAFEHGAGLVIARLDAAMDAESSPLQKLRAIAAYYRDPQRSTVRGGCPIMNTAIEFDSTNFEMRDRARQKFDRWRDSVAAAVTGAIEAGEIVPVDPGATATVFLCAIEGAVMLSMLYRTSDPLRQVSDHLEKHLDSLALASGGA